MQLWICICRYVYIIGTHGKTIILINWKLNCIKENSHYLTISTLLAIVSFFIKLILPNIYCVLLHAIPLIHLNYGTSWTCITYATQVYMYIQVQSHVKHHSDDPVVYKELSAWLLCGNHLLLLTSHVWNYYIYYISALFSPLNGSWLNQSGSFICNHFLEKMLQTLLHYRIPSCFVLLILIVYMATGVNSNVI